MIKNSSQSKVTSFNTFARVPSKRHVITTYTRQGVHVKPIQRSPTGSLIKWITMNIHDLSIVNVYKPLPTTAYLRNLPSAAASSI